MYKFFRKRIWVFLLTLVAGQLQAGIHITEIMQSNFGGVIDYYNEFPDSWVELYNSGDEDIDLEMMDL